LQQQKPTDFTDNIAGCRRLSSRAILEVQYQNESYLALPHVPVSRNSAKQINVRKPNDFFLKMYQDSDVGPPLTTFLRLQFVFEP
jgi:hypothetical protein